MGRLLDGVWKVDWCDTKSSGGRFVRTQSQFRNFITADGASGFKAEPGRYHLYVSLACPWAHRTLIVRKLKRLESAIGASIVDAVMGGEGWTFGEEGEATLDHVIGARRLHEVYTRAKPDYSGRVTVPVLWDKRTGIIVNNESAEIIRMFNSAFDHIDDRGRTTPDLYPVDLRADIDVVNAFVYENVNNGVYKAGFAATQAAYEEAFVALFDALEVLDRRLAHRRYLAGERITEADWRLFTTLVRFDAVYVGHFKCNLRRIDDYANLSNYLRELYQAPGVAETVDFDHIKRHYYLSHARINPTGVVPKGPALALDESHDRARLPGRRWAA